tara:strand:+ start:14020 stop:15294 length:1275 start_codon:yes stop_codon:yes gene_type:complete
MILVKFIRENKKEVINSLNKRQFKNSDKIINEIIVFDEKYRENLESIQKLQNKRNIISKELSSIKKNSKEFNLKSNEVTNLKNKINDLTKLNETIKAESDNLIHNIPNISHDTVPIGKNSKDNKEIKKFGDINAHYFKIKPHDEIGTKLNQMDFENAAKISRSRFVILKNNLALLERALVNFMLDVHTKENGYIEHSMPVIVNSKSMFGTSQLPKFENDQYNLGDDLWLTPTSEVSLTNIVAGKIIEYNNLPLRLVSSTQCFRKEAGAAGKDTKGMIRQHQFTKVELVSIIQPEKRLEELERLLSCAELILKKLEIPYRVVLLCSGDMGFSAEKTYDIEVWLPSQKNYREISSCSSCGIFQSVRMNSKYKTVDGKNEYLSTLNGSGLAVGRTIVAILENYQNSDGSITVPKVLVPYMNGCTKIN